MNMALKALSRFFPAPDTQLPRAPLPATDVGVVVRYLPDGFEGDLAVATINMENVAGTPCFTGHSQVDAQAKYGRAVAAMEAMDMAREKALAAGYDVVEVEWQARANSVQVERPRCKVLTMPARR
jgi:hypothetical protein